MERQKGLDALEILHYLADEFSIANEEFEGLSDLFLKPDRAVEAAVRFLFPLFFPFSLNSS